MKLSYLQSIDPCDPLPKLGAKVQPKKPESLESIRAREVEAFERGVFNAVKAAAEETGPRNFARSFAHDGTGYIEPEPVVSFADAAEMADGWIKWDGGECPVPVGAKVDIRFRDNSEYLNEDADGLCWRNHGDDWSTNIIAYRIYKEPEKKAVTFEDYCKAWERAALEFGTLPANAARAAVVGDYLKKGGRMSCAPHLWPAVIAALNELRR